MSVDKRIFESLMSKIDSEQEAVSRLSTVAAKLDVVLRNIEFCKQERFIFEGKVYSLDDVIILLFEFYLLSRKFEAIPTIDIEQLLSYHIGRLKQLAAQGRLNALIKTTDCTT